MRQSDNLTKLAGILSESEAEVVNSSQSMLLAPRRKSLNLQRKSVDILAQRSMENTDSLAWKVFENEERESYFQKSHNEKAQMI